MRDRRRQRDVVVSNAGYRVLSATRDRFRWPPFYRQIAALGGRVGFELACRI